MTDGDGSAGAETGMEVNSMSDVWISNAWKSRNKIAYYSSNPTDCYRDMQKQEELAIR